MSSEFQDSRGYIKKHILKSLPPKKLWIWGREMAWWLKAYKALVEDLNLIPSTFTISVSSPEYLNFLDIDLYNV